MKSIVVANWKMNPATWREARELFEATRKVSEKTRGVQLIVAPPAIFVRELRARYKGRRIAFGIQHIHSEKGGAYTGEISLAQAKDAGVAYAIIGHAERRAMGESNDDTRKKVAAALAKDMLPILCIGEESRTGSGEYLATVGEQLRIGLADVSSGQLARILISYEPVWAIGGEKTVAPRDMHEMAIFIRKTIVELHGEKGMSIKILYGGAATESNAAEMLERGDVDGLLIGHVSIDSQRFAALLQAIAKK